jgi:hypothetical protein
MQEASMPEKETLKRAERDKRQGKSPSTQAGEFVREEIHHIREGKHGASSTKQAIAIGLSKARRAGVKLSTPPAGSKARSKKSARYQGRRAASHAALAKQAKSTARRRSASSRKASARKAARTRQRRKRASM